MNKKTFLLAAIQALTFSNFLASDTQKQEPLILKIMNNSKQAAVLSEIEYSYAFTVNNKIQKHVIPNTTAIQFSPHQAKQLSINVSIPIPTTPKGASIEFNPMGITGIKIHSKKTTSQNKKISINPPYYHLNIANTQEAPSICINYNTKEGWHIESCKKVKTTKKTTQKGSKKTKKITTSTTAVASGVPAIPKEKTLTISAKKAPASQNAPAKTPKA